MINYRFFGINVNEGLFVQHLLTSILIRKDLIKLIKLASVFEIFYLETQAVQLFRPVGNIRNVKWQTNSQYEAKQMHYLIVVDYLKDYREIHKVCLTFLSY